MYCASPGGNKTNICLDTKSRKDNLCSRLVYDHFFLYQDIRYEIEDILLSFCAYSYTHIRLFMRNVYKNIIYIYQLYHMLKGVHIPQLVCLVNKIKRMFQYFITFQTDILNWNIIFTY